MSVKSKAKAPLWVVRISRAHARLWISLAVGVITFAMLPGDWLLTTRVLAGWDVAVGLYLAAAAFLMAKSPVAEIRRHAAAQDEGAFALLLLTVAAALVSLGAIFIQLAAIDRSAPGYGGHVALVILTVVLSWAFTHTIFALHYAYEFYGEAERAKGLRFPEDDRPDYWDFIYFSFVIGMTFQVSDVQVTHKWLRRTVTAHGVISFIFTTAIIALTVNMAANSM